MLVGGHGHRARFGVKVPFAICACCVLPPGGNLATAGEDWKGRRRDDGALVARGAERMGALAFGARKMRRNFSRSERMRAVFCASCLNHEFAVIGAVVYPDARQLLSLGLDGVAKVWRVENEEFLCQGGAGLSALGFGGNIFTASLEGSIERFSDDGRQLSVFPDESRVLTAGEDGLAIVWQMSGSQHKKLGPFDSPVLCRLFEMNDFGTNAVADSWQETFAECELKVQMPSRSAHLRSGADVSACCQWILTGCKDGTARLFNASSGNQHCSWQLGQKATRAISPNATLEEAEKGQLETHRVQTEPKESMNGTTGCIGLGQT
eukprot:Skav234205  [mRNA]  locus=scaffold2795:87739:91393:- [translate_table: standard]